MIRARYLADRTLRLRALVRDSAGAEECLFVGSISLENWGKGARSSISVRDGGNDGTHAPFVVDVKILSANLDLSWPIICPFVESHLHIRRIALMWRPC